MSALVLTIAVLAGLAALIGLIVWAEERMNRPIRRRHPYSVRLGRTR